MKMKKAFIVVIALAIVAVMCVCLAACDGDKSEGIKVGLICLHDENSTYDKNFIDAMNEVQRELNLTDTQVIIATGIPETDDCYQKACELADSGCDIIFADSFGHESYMLKAAKQYPDVQFCHATGTMAHTEKLDNFANAFASIYEGRYLAGLAAGMKLNEMIAAGDITADEARMGYVGAFTYAEVISGYTSFYLGAKSVCPTVEMDVTFTGSWYDEAGENNSAQSLIKNHGCKLISQHADSMGAPNACEEKGVPNVSYNGSTKAACPDTFIVSSRINWAPYFKFAIESVRDKGVGSVPADTCLGIKDGAVVLTEFGSNVAEGTAEAVAAAREKLINGTLKVFDVTKDNYITVKGKKVTEYLADVDTDADFTKDTQVIVDGQFKESSFRSAPYFDIEIDGITLLDRNYGKNN